MNVFFTADLHVGHANIIPYCNRPYATVNEMNEGIVERWNNQVAPDDIVFVLGDACMGQLAESIKVVDRLNGDKRLVPGNHDPIWSGCPEKRRDRWLDEYFNRFAICPETLSVPEILDERVDRRHDVMLCHFPFRAHDHRDFDEYRPIDKGQWLIHGHIHDLYRQKGRQINVGLDAWGGHLVHVDTLRGLIYKGERNLDVIPWAS